MSGDERHVGANTFIEQQPYYTRDAIYDSKYILFIFIIPFYTKSSNKLLLPYKRGFTPTRTQLLTRIIRG